MTTENVTILFTDMVGSTALASSLAADAADELRRGHFSILRRAVSESGGSEVKNLGDGLMVVFGSASAALSCAVAMQQGVERDNRAREKTVGLRVGLSGGEVSKEDDDYFGDPVIEAARLCARCESEQVLAADVVRLMAGRRSHQECRPLGELTLKGLPDPVAIVEVAWEPLDGADSGSDVPLPERLGVRPAVGVVGRETETSTMLDAFKRVVAGEGREVILVSGEAGLGKTTLVADLARAAFDGGACVLFGHCEEDLASPYQLFSEALGHYVTHAPEERLVAHVDAHGSELARLVPALASRIRDLPPPKATDADTERFLLFSAVVGLLVQVSNSQPVVVVLDDLQWADKASLLLLRHLIASELTMRVLIVGIYRDSELSRSHPFVEILAALHRERGVSRIELSGLDDAGVIAIMAATAGHSLDEAGVGLARAVCRETDGNPFFVSEVLIHLAETGAISQDADGRWTADASLEQLSLPDSVRVVIGARVGRLGSDAERVLSVAAVIGRDFDLDLLARATKTSEDELLDVLDAAMAVALVREVADTGGYCFAHALIQHTLYEDLGHNRRARAHRQVAEALEVVCGDRPGARVGELARHWCRATQPSDVAKAINYSRQAGDSALAALAPAVALRYYAQAIDLYAQATDPDPILEIDLAIGLGTAQRQTGDPAFRDTLLGGARRAAAVGDTERLVAAALANNRGFFTAMGVQDLAKIEILELALDRLPVDDPDRALVLAALCLELTYGSSLARLQPLADEAIAIAMASGDDTVIVRVLNDVAQPLRVPVLLGRLLTLSADALARAENVGDPALLFWAAHNRTLALTCAGEIGECDRYREIMESMAKQVDDPTLHWMNTMHSAGWALIAGDSGRAEHLAKEALRIGTDGGQPDVAATFGAQLIHVNWQRGTLSRLLPGVEQGVAEYPGIPAFAGTLAVAYLEADRTDDAHHLLAEFAATDFDLPVDLNWISGMLRYADVAIECRDTHCAQPLFDRLAPWASQFSFSGGSAEGPVSHVLGGLATVLGRYDEADAYFAQAAASSNRMRAKFFAARTNLAWGKMLTERSEPNDIEKARELLTKAHTAAVAYGYAIVERRAHQALHDPD
jgi:class 3 adenylate cyclase